MPEASLITNFAVTPDCRPGRSAPSAPLSLHHCHGVSSWAPCNTLPL